MKHQTRTTSGLVALGAAGVVAVYAAGYVRTAAAAQHFRDESNERRAVPVRDASSPPGAGTAGQTSDARMVEKFGSSASGAVAQSTKSVVAVPNVPSSASNTRSSASNAFAKALLKQGAKSTAAKSLSDDEAVKNAMASAASKAMIDTATASTKSKVVRTSVAQTMKPPATAVAETTTTPPAAAAEAPVKPEKTALPPGVKWHDGRFVGYGQSRHGDIEATIEVWEGKISYVAISQCLTQYSCSFIEKLPQQVFDRQSANVDNVSGATQSSNAFYYAIVQALQKTK